MLTRTPKGHPEERGSIQCETTLHVLRTGGMEMVVAFVRVSAFPSHQTAHLQHGAHGVVVSHPLRMRKALGSNPSVSILWSAAR